MALPASASSTQGIVRGLVVDSAVRPIANATAVLVATGATASSDTDGLFFLGPLDPGFYTVNVTKPGFHSLELGVTVLADVDEPPLATFILDVDQATAAFFEQFHWSGFIQCGFGTPVPGYSPMACNAVAGASNEAHQALIQVPTFVQSELTWTSTQALNNQLQLTHRGIDGIYAKQEGADPVILNVPNDVLRERLPEDLDLVTDVFTIDTDVDVVFGQTFDVYTTVFYNFVPPEGWTFIADGAPEVPK